MRVVPVVLAGLVLSLPALAQVTTNNGALDSLAAPAKPAGHPATKHTTHPAPRATTPAHSAQAAPAASPARTEAPAQSAKTAKPAIPATPPAILALPPAIAVPLAHPPPTPVIPLVADAPGEATAISNGLRITFGPDRADLNQAAVDALTQFAATVLDQSTTSVNLFAYATGSQDDPSTPRRLSLQRALAARAVLMKAGIASTRIYPRALGPIGGDEPDRVDVVTGTPTPPQAGQTALPQASHVAGSVK